MNEEKYRELSLRERFDAKCLSVVKYARSHKLSQPILSYVLNGNNEVVSGRRNTKAGVARKVYQQLKADGIWLGALPWEK